MQFCTTCGRYLSEYDVVCPECGTVIHPEALQAMSQPYRYRWIVLLLSLAITAVAVFFASFYLKSFFLFLLIPFILLRWDRSRPLGYILMGVSFGAGIGLIAYWIYSYSGLF